ncbi:MAG: hypothetical protein HC765_05820 [Brachymonas sp.]|nr:hypothetical protein [Brachymonas sp.]
MAARHRGDELIVQVFDTGIGIAPEQQEEVFKEFHQLGNLERDRQKGLGLGLAIAKGLAQNMLARIELRSQPGKGSVFSLCLSAWKPAQEPAVISLRSGGWNADQLANTAPLTHAAVASETLPPATHSSFHSAFRSLRVLDRGR